ncbi:GGDEF domain-containing protein [Vagococcus sp. DIV0080]|uniref:GGDEF domain-containing protein n=1 Tax=Candidatus Vagococcus giribetii TaxID=2230876 RepID=A0ABS3HX22_9ENTE|nr:GGDEF domain-containing protein [Vagococcus sp. DIV0080]MBO0477737.1 GGDEF domain-containing protein [Vagococcus sp. DIV0080]
MVFNFFNAFIINLAIIVSVTLGLYFFSLKYSLKNKQLDDEFLLVSKHLEMSTVAKIFSGVFIGVMAFIISKNGIPVGDYRPVDVRYLPVYFSVYYGSPLIGLITTVTLTLFKCIDYLINQGTPTEFFHNIIITYFILGISILIYRKNLSPRKGTFLCLLLTLVVRATVLMIAFFPHIDFLFFYKMGINFSIFSALFLFTGWLIHRAISISEGIHVYRTSAVFDSLTGLYNKEYFYFFLDLAYNQAIREEKTFALAIIDVDDFKQINDTYGHLVGDKVLSEISTILKNNLKPESIMRNCRIGGDEFAVVFKHGEYDTDSFFQGVFEQLNELISESACQKKVTLSVGLVEFQPDSSQPSNQTVQDLFNLVDETLYEAKKSGKNQLIKKELPIHTLKK